MWIVLIIALNSSPADVSEEVLKQTEAAEGAVEGLSIRLRALLLELVAAAECGNSDDDCACCSSLAFLVGFCGHLSPAVVLGKLTETFSCLPCCSDDTVRSRT
jgi:hypothetical protein